MSYTQIKLFRHADAQHMQTPEIIAGRAAYSVLTPEGAHQARALGESWHRDRFVPRAAHTSPLKRAADTLAIALRTSGNGNVQVSPKPELAEQCLGWHEGKPRDQIYTPYLLWMIELQGAMFRHQGLNQEGVPGESLMGVTKRMTSYLIETHVESPYVSEPLPPVVAMTHHVALKGLVSYLDLGGLHGPVNPIELQRLTLSREAVEPCAETLMIIEGGPDPESIRINVEYIGKPLGA